MRKITYYLETPPQAWNGIRQMHVGGCGLLPEKEQVKPIGAFTRAITAMSEARKIHRRAGSCFCYKAL